MNGILNINKPPGITSHDVVGKVRRLTGKVKVGHTGTLDPMACGVLPLCVGQATRIAQYLNADIKIYRAQIRLGVETDTLDRTGQILSQKDCRGISSVRIEETLTFFRGNIEQLPPMYSALKVGGERMYKLARQGITVERKPRPVRIYRLESVDFSEPDFTIEVECSAGTYIRSLASDIGQKLGCGATLWELTRTKSGQFDLKESLTLEHAGDLAAQNRLDSALIGINQVLGHLPEITIKEFAVRLIRNGVKIGVDSFLTLPPLDLGSDVTLRLLSPEYKLIALGVIKTVISDELLIQPKLVFSEF
ncbi:MAG: tRNA pseudouridine(55) synthase TruB [Candidatus Schekmanbacteria bacterium]|nr:tRNA pseudouridine(55) synthase TruB [Candidatus Schekmanbacteria bacterium]